MLRSVSALCDSWSRRSWWTMTRLLSDIRFQLQPNQLTAVDRPRAPEVANRQATQVTFCVRGVMTPPCGVPFPLALTSPSVVCIGAFSQRSTYNNTQDV